MEVNTSTNKIKHPVHIVLMNDTLLVATRKKKTAAQSKFKLLGDRCWQLTEITIEDMKDTAGMCLLGVVVVAVCRFFSCVYLQSRKLTGGFFVFYF